MSRIAILSLSDGRDFVSRDTADFIRAIERDLQGRLNAAGHDVVVADEIVTSAELATSQARRLRAAAPDLTVLNYGVWAFPHFTLLAAAELDGPLLLLSNVDATYPGMVGMLAGGGGLDQIGRRHERAWGDASDPDVLTKIATAAKAASAVQALRGATFGRIGGRSMGMYTAVADPATWIDKFGVDVEEIDQWEIVRRAELQDQKRVEHGRKWLEEHATVHYDGKQLTPESLERQIRSYHAMRELIDEWGLDFTGIKAQPELTTHFATMDITEAFLNDPYDWEGPKEPHVCATEADMDGALTMQLLKGLTHTPVLFADVRAYDAQLDVWDLCNSGQHATWFASRSDDPAQNLSKVHLYPEDFYFPAGGASVHHIAAAGDFTFARLTRLDGRYRMQITKGELVEPEASEAERLMRASTYEWPHAFAKLEASVDDMLGRFGANHIHAVPGDVEAELHAICRMLDIDVDRMGEVRTNGA